MTVNTRDEHNFWRSAGLLSAASMVLISGALLSGCGEEEAPPPPPKREAPPPPPPEPDPVQLSSLMGGADARVQFPQEKAPYDRSLAEAVIAFAGSLASGDDAALSESLTLSGRGILDSMLADGTWFDATDKIEAVRVVYLGQQPDVDTDAFSAEFVLAVQEPGGAYTLGWSATETDGGWVMSPVPTADATLPRAADWDGSSMGAYASAAGWSGAVGETAGGALPTDDDSAVMVFVAAETVARLMGEDGVGDLEPAMASQFAAMAGGSQQDAEAAIALIAQGKSLVGEGRRVDTAQAQQLVNGLVSAAGMMGQSWGEDDILAAMAEAMGISEDEMREIYEG